MHCKLFVLSTLSMPGYAHPNWNYHLGKNLRVYLQAKNQLHSKGFSGDTAKMCKLLIWGSLGIPGYTRPKWWYQLVEDFAVYLHAKNKLHHFLLSRDITFQRILRFDWLTALWPINREPKFWRIWD